MSLETYNVKQATHMITCRHCIGRSCKVYAMYCIPLHTTKAGKLKIVVFGDRGWRNTLSVKKIRYVNADAVKELNNEQINKLRT